VRWFSDEMRWLLAHASNEKAAYLPMQVIIKAMVSNTHVEIYSIQKNKVKNTLKL
jgi:hypothetical protein